MKVSRKKNRLYKTLEVLGIVLFVGTLIVTLLLAMVGVDIGNAYGSGILMLVGAAVGSMGVGGRSNLYRCPVCKRKLLVQQQIFKTSVMNKLPEVCPCGWRVEIEEE